MWGPTSRGLGTPSLPVDAAHRHRKFFRLTALPEAVIRQVCQHLRIGHCGALQVRFCWPFRGDAKITHGNSLSQRQNGQGTRRTTASRRSVGAGASRPVSSKQKNFASEGCVRRRQLDRGPVRSAVVFMSSRRSQHQPRHASMATRNERLRQLARQTIGQLSKSLLFGWF